MESSETYLNWFELDERRYPREGWRPQSDEDEHRPQLKDREHAAVKDFLSAKLFVWGKFYFPDRNSVFVGNYVLPGELSVCEGKEYLEIWHIIISL